LGPNFFEPEGDLERSEPNDEPVCMLWALDGDGRSTLGLIVDAEEGVAPFPKDLLELIELLAVFTEGGLGLGLAGVSLGKNPKGWSFAPMLPAEEHFLTPRLSAGTPIPVSGNAGDNGCLVEVVVILLSRQPGRQS
jgi:hypothetical protein